MRVPLTMASNAAELDISIHQIQTDYYDLRTKKKNALTLLLVHQTEDAGADPVSMDGSSNIFEGKRGSEFPFSPVFGKPFDCGDLHAYQSNYQPGVHPLRFTSSLSNTVEAVCTSDGWTRIQSRGQFGNPEDYFLRNWTQYVEGFGIPGMLWNIKAG